MLAVSPATAGGDGAAALAVTTTASTAVAASTAIVANRGNAAGRLLSFEEIDARGLLDGTAATGSFVADLGVEAEMDKEEEEDDDDDDAVIYGELNDDDDDESAVGRSDRVEQVVAKRQDAKCGDDEDEDDEDDEDEVIYGELNDGGGILDADGNVRQRTAVSEQRVLYDTIELRDGRTWYTNLGDGPFIAALLVLLCASWWFTRQRRREPVR